MNKAVHREYKYPIILVNYRLQFEDKLSILKIIVIINNTAYKLKYYLDSSLKTLCILYSTQFILFTFIL